MTPERIRRVAAIGAIAWILFSLGDLVRTSAGPAVDPALVIGRTVVGPLVLLAAGQAMAWFMARFGHGDSGAVSP